VFVRDCEDVPKSGDCLHNAIPDGPNSSSGTSASVSNLLTSDVALTSPVCQR
jgi:hypothetical protein